MSPSGIADVAGRRLPRGTRRCENCDGPVAKGFTHEGYNGGRYTCKRVDWKRRALKAQRDLADLRNAIKAADRIVDDNDWEDCVAFYGEVREAAGLKP